MNGVIILDKPQEFTSFDAVAVMRGLAHERKIGHTGTLDPMATGVLPLLLGRAAKAADLLEDTGKEYRAGFRFGMKTDTGDVTGKTTKTDEVSVQAKTLEEVLKKFRGEILQLPPMYSAVSVNGQRLYTLARQGIEIEREKRRVVIEVLETEEYDEHTREGTLRVCCSKGTYIRTLIEDIAEAAGSCGVMTALRRTRACGFCEADAYTLEKLRELEKDGKLEEALRSTESLFENLSATETSPAQGQRFLNGGSLDLQRLKLPKIAMLDNQRLRVLSVDGNFLGLGKIDLEKNELKHLKLFAGKEDFL